MAGAALAHAADLPPRLPPGEEEARWTKIIVVEAKRGPVGGCRKVCYVPYSGLTVKVYNEKNKLLFTRVTNDDGKATLNFGSYPRGRYLVQMSARNFRSRTYAFFVPLVMRYEPFRWKYFVCRIGTSGC